MQLFVRGLDGASSVLELPAEAPASQLKLAVQVWIIDHCSCTVYALALFVSSIAVFVPVSSRRYMAMMPSDTLLSSLQELCGIPAPAQILRFSSRILQDGRSLSSQGLCQDSTVQVTARLLGGKGGFGALLRGQGRDGKITTNFDACRDLSGRRIRYQTAEEKLQKWKEEEKERELEKVAMKHLKEQAKKEKLEQQAQVCICCWCTGMQHACTHVGMCVRAVTW
jgi:hypothetical protein